MESNLGKVSLSDIMGGVLRNGIVPFDRLRRLTVEAQNGSIIAIAAGLTEIVPGDCGDVLTDDVIFVQTYCLATKGGTAGALTLDIRKKSGTATIAPLGGGTSVIDGESSVPIAGTFARQCLGIFTVTNGGTLVMQLGGTSAGSNSSVAAGFGSIGCIVFYGQ